MSGTGNSAGMENLEMDWLDPVLKRIRDPLGRRRFYAPGSHPVTARLREEIRKLESLPSSEEVDAALAHLRNQVAMFEEGESLAKQAVIRRADSEDGLP